MIFALIVLFCGILVSVVAAWYSIIGLMSIFAAAKIPIAIMGGVLEVSKIVCASWLYRNWKIVPLFLRIYFISAVIILMLITSLGIFGFLSKAHIEQNAPIGFIKDKIERIDKQVKVKENRVVRSEQTLDKFDSALDKYIELGFISKGLKRRDEQKDEIESLNQIIYKSNEEIDVLLLNKLELETQIKNVELEVGPLRYITELIYGENASDYLDNAVRGVILLLIFVFDPLAVLLIIAGNMSLLNLPKKKHKKIIPKKINVTKEKLATLDDIDEEPKFIQESLNNIIDTRGKSPRGYGNWKFRIGDNLYTFEGDYDMIKKNAIKKAIDNNISKIELIDDSVVQIIR